MVYKLDAATGQVQWNFSIAYRPSFTGGNQMLGSPSVAAGKVFASSNWGDYYALDTQHRRRNLALLRHHRNRIHRLLPHLG